MAYLSEWTSGYLDFVNVAFADGAQGPDLLSSYRPGPVRPLTRDQVPEVAYLDGWEQYLPAFMAISAHLSVSREIKDVIEALEPERHQFFPVSIQRKGGGKPILAKDSTPLQEPYYLLHPGVRLDAVWIEKSDVKVHQFGSQPALVHARLGADKVVLRREVVEGHHLWSGQWHLGGKVFFSDTLFQIVQERKWKGRRFIHLREE